MALLLPGNNLDLELPEPLLQRWTRTALSTRQVDPFCCTPPWQLSFHHAFAPERALLIRESSGNLLLFAEKVLAPDNILLTPIEQNWLFGCPLLGKQAVELLADTLVEIQHHYSPYFPRIVISGIRPGGVLAKRLIHTFSRDFRLFQLIDTTSTQCSASLANGVDGYLSRRSARQRKKLRSVERAATDCGIWFERASPTTPEAAAETFSRILAVEQTSWKGIELCGMDQEPAASFYNTMTTRLAATTQAYTIFAKHESEDIGYIFGGLAGKIYRGQQFSYSEQWRDHSIGNLLQLEKIRWLSEQGCKRYDMGPISGPKMDYKRHWTEQRGHLESWILVRKG